jgi:hypothetical protein
VSCIDNFFLAALGFELRALSTSDPSSSPFCFTYFSDKTELSSWAGLGPRPPTSASALLGSQPCTIAPSLLVEMGS